MPNAKSRYLIQMARVLWFLNSEELGVYLLMIYRDLFGGIYRNKSKLLYDSYIIFYSLEILIMPHGSSSTGSLKSCYSLGIKKT